MRTAYFHGIQNSRNTYWMGQGEDAAQAGSPLGREGSPLGREGSPGVPSTRLGQLEWLPGLLQSGGTAFGQYENAQAAKDAEDAAKAKAAAAASQTQTAAITASSVQAQLNANKILGLDPGMFWGGLAVLGVLGVAGVVIANKK